MSQATSSARYAPAARIRHAECKRRHAETSFWRGSALTQLQNPKETQDGQLDHDRLPIGCMSANIFESGQEAEQRSKGRVSLLTRR